MSTAIVLNTDCWARIFGQLNLTGLRNVALVCKDFEKIQSETQALWTRFVPLTFKTELPNVRERVRLFSQLFITLGSTETANECVLDLYQHKIKQVKDAKVEDLCELAMSNTQMPNGSFVIYIPKSLQACVVIKDLKGEVHHIVEFVKKARWGDEPAIISLRLSSCLPPEYFEYREVQLIYSQEDALQTQRIASLVKTLRGHSA